MASLFQACKSAVRNKEGGTFNIGGYDIDIEMMTQKDIDDNVKWGNISFGDSDESKILLMASETITVPESYTLTPDSPKKSLVIFCNTLINNGTISMYKKAPNVLPHDYYIIQGNIIGSNKNVVIPAYANNSTGSNNGQNGTERQCGSGGLGTIYGQISGFKGIATGSKAGSGYAFGGGAGGGAGCNAWGDKNDTSLMNSISVNETYPMRGGSPTATASYGNLFSGVGNPASILRGSISHSETIQPAFGCGGRIIVFCNSFENNGVITANGTNQTPTTDATDTTGGASGAGAVDIFYTVLNTQGTITATGGTGSHESGNGGNGSITLTQWNLDKVIKEERKMFTKNNWIYLFNNYSQRLREDII